MKKINFVITILIFVSVVFNSCCYRPEFSIEDLVGVECNIVSIGRIKFEKSFYNSEENDIEICIKRENQKDPVTYYFNLGEFDKKYFDEFQIYEVDLEVVNNSSFELTCSGYSCNANKPILIGNDFRELKSTTIQSNYNFNDTILVMIGTEYELVEDVEQELKNCGMGFCFDQYYKNSNTVIRYLIGIDGKKSIIKRFSEHDTE